MHCMRRMLAFRQSWTARSDRPYRSAKSLSVVELTEYGVVAVSVGQMLSKLFPRSLELVRCDPFLCKAWLALTELLTT